MKKCLNRVLIQKFVQRQADIVDGSSSLKILFPTASDDTIEIQMDISQQVFIPVYQMNVDIENFHEVRQLIRSKRLIEKSTHISFDLEFTGLRFVNNERERVDMFLNDKYPKMVSVASKFNIIQLGLTFVVPHGDTYLAYPFNFYLFPRKSMQADPVISMQAGCVEFNSKQKMDWNRWINKGINFVRICDLDKCLNSQKQKTYDQMYEYLDQNHREIIENLISKLNSPDSQQLIKFSVPKFSSLSIKKTIEKYNEFKNMTYVFDIAYGEEKQEKFCKIVANKLNRQEFEQQKEIKKEQAAGFTLIFNEIWLSRDKIFLGHNCLYDILFMYSSFVDQLPTNYNNFKSIVRENRYFYDTKLIANQLQDKDQCFPQGTTLEEIYKHYHGTKSGKIDLELAKGFEDYNLSKQILHEAGFDSFLTAWAFFQLGSRREQEGKLNIFCSFYHMDIRSPSDRINQEVSVFVVPVGSLTYQYMQIDELRRQKTELLKKLRNFFYNKEMLSLINTIQGQREVFVYAKEKTHNRLLIEKLNTLSHVKEFPKIFSLQTWIMQRSYQVDNHTKKTQAQ